jgi:penicillin-binding protein A
VARTITREAPARRPAPQRRDRLTRRLLPILALAGLALLIGIIVGAGHVPAERTLAQQFGAAWHRGDYGAMYDMIGDDARRHFTPLQFASAYRAAAATATSTGVDVGKPTDPDNGVVRMPVAVRTRVWGTVRRTLSLPFSGDGDSAKVDWRPNLTFPGLEPGQHLSRQTALGQRGDILARNGAPMVTGVGRAVEMPAAQGISGEVGTPGPVLRHTLRPLGYPPDARVGTSGLELALNPQLAGTPGGILRGGGHVIARSSPKPGANVKTTIDPDAQRAAVTALGGRLGGAAVLKPDGEILALAGIAATDLQPPGSTFKMITLTAVLEAGAAKPGTVFPYQTETHLEGVRLENANGESCGGTLVQSFANSCNSVFAPLGAKIGASKLVQTAEKFGFNKPVGIPGFTESTLPEADKVGDALAVGSTAIGQGDVSATALQMATVAATIGNRGLRPQLSIELGKKPTYTRATSPRVARQVAKMMVAVVTGGTGTAAQIPGVVVAGKTGTAELGDTVDQSGNKNENAPETDAWFAAFAPVRQPRVAVGVLLVQAGAGADVGAPTAHDVLAATLQKGA